MFSIFKKEFRSFFGAATGYVVIGIFLLLNGLFLWVIPGEYNVLDNGYANVDGLFLLAPWLFLFLCPAVTMRMFAEERLSGTWELLQTKPLSMWAIAGGKYLSTLAVSLLALLPCVIYYFSVYYLAEPLGNVDSGAFWGSFIGLILLAAAYLAIGILAAALGSNQIISFILAALLCFFMLYGFDLLSAFCGENAFADTVESFGIQAHYTSVSRGVIDSHDIIYFTALIFIFLWLTVERLKKK
ncbi:MAG: gliding motility-associated ABC transporter permease subunit GldF [Paludibacter sp.]|nr:gliding motility-associated ABC transporter permease subunit GldF [Paludibacter sp.]